MMVMMMMTTTTATTLTTRANCYCNTNLGIADSTRYNWATHVWPLWCWQGPWNVYIHWMRGQLVEEEEIISTDAALDGYVWQAIIGWLDNRQRIKAALSWVQFRYYRHTK